MQNNSFTKHCRQKNRISMQNVDEVKAFPPNPRHAGRAVACTVYRAHLRLRLRCTRLLEIGVLAGRHICDKAIREGKQAIQSPHNVASGRTPISSSPLRRSSRGGVGGKVGGKIGVGGRRLGVNALSTIISPPRTGHVVAGAVYRRMVSCLTGRASTMLSSMRL